MIKAIETVYNGYRFRSRLEARWAVFFDTLDIQWEYEKEGYEMDGVRYLPDFWLPDLDCWVEIKGPRPTDKECEKAQLLAMGTQKDVFILWGELRPFRQEAIYLHTIEEVKEHWEETGEILSVGDLKYHGTLGHRFRFSQENGKVCWSDTFWVLHECVVCHKLAFGMSIHLPSDKPCECASQSTFDHASPRLIAAYTLARQARFEHKDARR